MLAHTYLHKPLRKIKVTICNHQADSPLYVWIDVWPGDLQVLKKYGHIWHWMPLLRQGVIKQHTTKPYHATSIHPGVMGTWWNEKWRIVNGISCRKCIEFTPEEIRPYKREFQYQGHKLWSLLNSQGSAYKHTHSHLFNDLSYPSATFNSTEVLQQPH